MRYPLLFCLALLGACSADTPTSPLPAGEISVSFSLPSQTLAVDGAGDQMDVERLSLSLGNPTLVGGACPTQCTTATTSTSTVVLTMDKSVSWATWSGASGNYTSLRIPVVLRTSNAGDLRIGTSVSFGGVFNGVAATQGQYFGAYITQLPIVTTINVPLPPSSVGQGARYSIRINPDSLLLNPNTNMLINIPRLVGNNPNAGDVAIVTNRLAAAMQISVGN